MNLSQITPLVITYNEATNIERCLSGLIWASRIVVVDSGSTDSTLEICGRYPQVEVIHRDFDTFANQCNFGLTQVRTPWVLSLDADYIVPSDFPSVLESLADDPSGYQTQFRYCIYGRPLSGTLYPARTVLYRTDSGRYADIGHGHRLSFTGVLWKLPCRIDHDDQKPLSRWLDSQRKYASREALHLTELTGTRLPLADRIRSQIWLAAPIVFLYVLFWKRAVLDGWPGWFYALQRTYAELQLSLELLELKLRPPEDKAIGRNRNPV